MNAHVDPDHLMVQEVEVVGVTAATIWRLRMSYLILQSASAVITVFKDRTGCSPETVKRMEEGTMPLNGMLDAMMAYTTALPHWLDIYMAALDAQNAYNRLFNAVATGHLKGVRHVCYTRPQPRPAPKRTIA